MKAFFNKLRVKNISVHIYYMDTYKAFKTYKEYLIQKKKININKIRYFITIDSQNAHESYLFNNVFLLRTVKKKGPVIGDCKTWKQFRGQSMYPYTINKIAKDLLESHINEVFIVVNQDNSSSIKGLEKAHFKKFASINATRWLFLYFKLNIKKHT